MIRKSGYRFSEKIMPSQESEGLLTQRLVAFAGHGLECIEINDLDDTPRIADGTLRLYLACDLGDRRAPNPEHLGEKFLRQHDGVTLGAVTRLQQPPAEPCLDMMQRVAGGGDARLREKNLVVIEAEVADLLA